MVVANTKVYYEPVGEEEILFQPKGMTVTHVKYVDINKQRFQECLGMIDCDGDYCEMFTTAQEKRTWYLRKEWKDITSVYKSKKDQLKFMLHEPSFYKKIKKQELGDYYLLERINTGLRDKIIDYFEKTNREDEDDDY